MKKIIFIYLVLTTMIFASTKDPYLGFWELNDGKAVIELVKENDEYSGYVRWQEDPEPVKETKLNWLGSFNKTNTEEEKTDYIGQKIAGGFKVLEDQLSDGWLFDSKKNKKYFSKVELIDTDTIKLKACLDENYVIGKTMKINRVSEDRLLSLLKNS